MGDCGRLFFCRVGFVSAFGGWITGCPVILSGGFEQPFRKIDSVSLDNRRDDETRG
jgi:hypothetical protein